MARRKSVRTLGIIGVCIAAAAILAIVIHILNQKSAGDENGEVSAAEAIDFEHLVVDAYFETLSFREDAGIVGVVADVADGEVHVVGFAGQDFAFGGKSHCAAVVFHTVLAGGAGDEVGGIGAVVASGVVIAASALIIVFQLSLTEHQVIT